MSTEIDKSKVVLYSYWRSSCSWRVRIALAYKKIKYEYHAIHLLKDGGQQKTDEYAHINPMKAIPALIIDGHIIGQSLAIMEYLEEYRPENPLLPKDLYARAIVRQMMQIIGSDIQPLQNLKVLQTVAEFTGQEEKKAEWAKRWIANGFNGLEKLLEKHSGQFCYGDQVSFADLCLPAQVYNANRFNVDMSHYPLIQKINKHLATIPEFIEALPSNQPDAEVQC
ncbi:maleylacetoacetate isomerase [Tieghemostelium lacteum]|uniref:maleylacetoacetate isomerase n=1 Tax=Tieghemostelium lacteum TaxID=361077 RepID=A0A152A972_TIELA|nr:maleylacetoacetate isomerase [Tieghemostelium lacteum]|eukprot:KYR02770.1 maleylacetoacetate isomerase [Tieghemostelium lacteum]